MKQFNLLDKSVPGVEEVMRIYQNWYLSLDLTAKPLNDDWTALHPLEMEKEDGEKAHLWLT